MNKRPGPNLPPLNRQMPKQHAPNSMKRRRRPARRTAQRAQAMNDVRVKLAAALDPLRIFVRNGQPERIFNLHHQFNQIQTHGRAFH
ncbi:MAG: hypothetical protein JWN40_1710 [Phycisphaerales bacterium]|nr:hypothetical protein [Phycisphaerales bacterium]